MEQTRPGGSIVLPWMPMPGQWGQQLCLDVLDDGTAAGTVHGECGFMMLRAQHTGGWSPYPHDGIASTTRVDPRGIYSALERGFALALAATAPQIVITTAGWENGDGWSGWVMRLREVNGLGWAIAVAPSPGGATAMAQVTQAGDRRLWTELESAYMQWLRAGRPGPGHYHMTVTPCGQEVCFT